jgi:hypothetical protein
VKESFNNNVFLDSKNLSSTAFPIISLSNIDCGKLLLFKKPKIEFDVRIFYHPDIFSLGIKKESVYNLSKISLQMRFFLSMFSGSHSEFGGISFFKLKNSSFKFRKRKNVYFLLNYRSAPNSPVEFFQELPSFLKLCISLARRLRTYSLFAPIIRAKYRKNEFSLFFLNPHFFSFYSENREILKKSCIVRFRIKIPRKHKRLLFSILKSVAKKRKNKRKKKRF